MPGRIPDPRSKDAAVNKALRVDGPSTEEAARISNASPATSSSEVAATGGGHSPDYEDWSVDELRRRAAELDVAGRSTMHKDELIAALRNR